MAPVGLLPVAMINDGVSDGYVVVSLVIVGKGTVFSIVGPAEPVVATLSSSAPCCRVGRGDAVPSTPVGEEVGSSSSDEGIDDDDIVTDGTGVVNNIILVGASVGCCREGSSILVVDGAPDKDKTLLRVGGDSMDGCIELFDDDSATTGLKVDKESPSSTVKNDGAPLIVALRTVGKDDDANVPCCGKEDGAKDGKPEAACAKKDGKPVACAKDGAFVVCEGQF